MRTIDDALLELRARIIVRVVGIRGRAATDEEVILLLKSKSDAEALECLMAARKKDAGFLSRILQWLRH